MKASADLRYLCRGSSRISDPGLTNLRVEVLLHASECLTEKKLIPAMGRHPLRHNWVQQSRRQGTHLGLARRMERNNPGSFNFKGN
jgi:hypothetical protein